MLIAQSFTAGTMYLKEIHRGLGYLLALIILVALVWCLVELFREEDASRGKTITVKSLVGLADLQVLLGLILFFLYPVGARPTLEHPAVMILAVGLFHAGSKMKGWLQFGLFVIGALFVGRGIITVCSFC